MVKKSSFLEKLFGGKKAPRRPESRSASGSEARKESLKPRAELGKADQARPVEPLAGARPAGGVDLRAGAQPVDPVPEMPEAEELQALEEPRVAPAAGSAPVAPRAKGNKREEAATALVDGFRDLSGLLHGIQDRLDEQSRRGGELNEKFHDLPAMARAQVDFMTRISGTLAKTEARSAEFMDKIGKLPVLLENLEKTLERQVATEERTEQTLGEFRETMDRIHGSIGTLTTENRAAMSTAVESFERTQDKTTRAFSEAQKLAHSTFEKSQEAHLDQIRALVDKGNRVNKNMVWLMFMVLGALIILFVAVLNS